MDTSSIDDAAARVLESEERPVLVHRLLTAAAAGEPEAIALRDDAGCITYAELANSAERVSQWLLNFGIRRGDRIAVDAVPDRRFVAMLYGCLSIGGIFVPVPPAITSAEREFLLRDAAPALVVASQPSPEPYGPVTLPTQALWQQLSETPGSGRPAEVDPSDAALLIYTSGSTSRPKGVLGRHAQVAFAVRSIGARLRYQADDIVFTRLPMSFDYGLYQIFLCTEAKAAIVLAGPGADARLLNEIIAARATVVPIVPALADMLIALAPRSTGRQSVRLFTNTGERLDDTRITALRDGFPGASVQLMYGLTECKRVSIGEPDGDITRPGSVGTPLDGTAVVAVDASGKPLEPLATGELVVSGPHVMDGYWRAPEATQEIFQRGVDGHTALHTGDWGYLDADGHIYLEGRRDDQFKSRGVRTSSVEIETAANMVPGVRRAVVLPPRDHNEAVLCVSSDLPPTEVLRLLRDWLEPAKIPRQCRVFTALPISSNGKVDRARLAEKVRE